MSPRRPGAFAPSSAPLATSLVAALALPWGEAQASFAPPRSGTSSPASPASPASPTSADAPAATEPPPDCAAGEACRTIEVESRVPADADPQAAADRRSPGFSRASPVDLDRSGRAADDLASAFERTPGVRVRSLGGLGQFSGLQIRGSSSAQVQVFLDGVPQTDGYGGVSDLASLSLDGLQRVEIYRGYVPIEFGGATIGGAVDLVGTADPEGTGRTEASLHAGYGWFSTREAGASLRQRLDRRGRWSMGVLASYGGSAGDFPYFDDGGTPRLDEDDGTRRRRNNDYDRGLGAIRLDGRAGAWRLSTQLRANWLEQGIAGRANTQSTDARQRSGRLRHLLRASRGRFDDPVTLEWVAGLALGLRRYRDPLGQIGTGVDDQRARDLDAYVSPRLAFRLWPGARVRVVADLRAELVEIDELDPPPDVEVIASGDATRRRLSNGVGLELDQGLFSDDRSATRDPEAGRWRLVPAIRFDTFQSAFRVPAGEGELSDEGRDRSDLAVSPRFGTRVRLVPGAELRASVSRYFRAPTMFELFGDRGYVVGNEGLRPERGYGGDLGAIYSLRWGGPRSERHRLYAQVAGFLSRADDLIAFVQSGLVVRAQNLEGADNLGVESLLELAVFDGDLLVLAEYTQLHSRNRSPELEQAGRPLPGRPRHQGSLALDLGHAFASPSSWARLEPRVRYELDAVSELSLDPSERVRLPGRLLHGLVVSLHWLDRVHLVASVRNLADARTASIVPSAGPPDPVRVPISDFIGYPLPGRSYFLRLGFDFG